ncbi:MAG: DUF2808 domain-containing protein [Synechococcaceae cyanobacterium]
MVEPLCGVRGNRALSSVLVLCVAAAAAPLFALELRGRNVFVRPPSEVRLITYSSTTWSPSEYFLTIEMPPEADAPLGALTIRQIGGVDRQFPFFVDRTRAFLGRPRQEGREVPVEVRFVSSERLFTLAFPEAIAPGSTMTVALVPWLNPSQADVYVFEVVAYPAGMNPEASPVGVVNLRIYDPFD